MKRVGFALGGLLAFDLGLDGRLFAFQISQPSFLLDAFVVLSAHKNLYIARVLRLCGDTMVIRPAQFNLYLGLLLLALATGCQTRDGGDKPVANLRVHMEVSPQESAMNSTVPVYRANPVMVNVDQNPMLTEDDVAEARLVDLPGGFAIQIRFDAHGSIVLNQNFAADPGRHYAIYSEFGTGKFRLKRWLAAPLLPKRPANGVLTFTPDADRDEAMQIVDGLNNFVKDKD